jgi:hypothetical protein
VSLTQKLNPEQRKAVDALLEKHGKGNLFGCLVEGELVVCRRPTIGEWDEFQSHCHDDAKKPTAIRDLIDELVVHPSVGDWQDVVRRQPGLPVSVSDSGLFRWLGVGAQAEGEAL